MATSDLIAEFILSAIEHSDTGFAELQRSALAERFSCVLCSHKEDRRPTLTAFLAILSELYQKAVAFPL